MHRAITLSLAVALFACGASTSAADDKDDLQALIQKARLSKDPKVRVRTLADIGKLGNEGKPASQAIIEIMLDRSPTIRNAASEALEKVNLPLHGPAVTLLVDENSEKRFKALDELVGLEEEAKPAVPLVLALFKVEIAAGGSSKLRVGGGPLFAGQLLRALAKIAPDDKGFQQALLDAITVKGVAARGTVKPEDFPATEIRGVAIELSKTLEKLDPKLLTKALISATNDIYCRVKAVDALGELGPRAKDAIPILKKLKIDGEQTVREAASAALEKVEGK